MNYKKFNENYSFIQIITSIKNYVHIGLSKVLFQSSHFFCLFIKFPDCSKTVVKRLLSLLRKEFQLSTYIVGVEVLMIIRSRKLRRYNRTFVQTKLNFSTKRLLTLQIYLIKKCLKRNANFCC